MFPVSLIASVMDLSAQQMPIVTSQRGCNFQPLIPSASQPAGPATQGLSPSVQPSYASATARIMMTTGPGLPYLWTSATWKTILLHVLDPMVIISHRLAHILGVCAPLATLYPTPSRDYRFCKILILRTTIEASLSRRQRSPQ